MGESSSSVSVQQEKYSLMMRMFQPLLFTSCLAGMVAASCSYSSPDQTAKASDHSTYQESCITALESQVRVELEASLQYLLMAAHFSQDTVNLPKVSDLFWTHADEERSHAIQFITYLRMRGATDSIFLDENPLKPMRNTSHWEGVGEALEMALEMEKEVTGRMKEMIDICSEAGRDDPAAADWLTGTWMEEQHQGQRHLAGLINTFNNFKADMRRSPPGCLTRSCRIRGTYPWVNE